MNEAQELFELATHAIDKTAIITLKDIQRAMDADLLACAVGEDGYYYCPTEKYNKVWEEVHWGEDEAMYNLALSVIRDQDFTGAVENGHLIFDCWVRIVKTDTRAVIAPGNAFFTHKERMGY